MTNKRKDWAISATALFVLAAAVWLWLAPGTARAAPNVTFQTLKGQRIDLNQMRGKPVLVSFWATTCAGCLEEMPHLVELYEELHPDGFEMVGVAMSYDPPSQVLELSEARELPYSISLDLDSAIANAFGEVQLTPTSFLIDPEGNIALHKLGALDLPALRQQIKSYL